ncbi:MAG TPA: hypothetical protein VNN12_09655 [Dehalococcoidia bacterium]|nr:hypothetical protein [Dehalococcoidia bacterium]
MRGSSSVQGAKIGLELGGAFCGWLWDAEGGHPTADVFRSNLQPGGYYKKHIGAVRYEDIVIRFGTGMCKALYDWIATGFRSGAPQNGAIVYTDYQSQELSRLEFTSAVITDLGMPALDAALRDAASMTIKLKPGRTRRVVSTRGAKIGRPLVASQWLPSNFRLTFPNDASFGSAVARVNKIEALTIRQNVTQQKVTENAVGQERDYEQEPTSVEVPNLVITLAESHAKPFYDWHEDFVVRGRNTDDKEKNATLEYLAPDLTTSLFTLSFKNVGIIKIAPERSEAGNQGVRRVKIEMYCEDIKFNYAPGAAN